MSKCPTLTSKSEYPTIPGYQDSQALIATKPSLALFPNNVVKNPSLGVTILESMDFIESLDRISQLAMPIPLKLQASATEILKLDENPKAKNMQRQKYIRSWVKYKFDNQSTVK